MGNTLKFSIFTASVLVGLSLVASGCSLDSSVATSDPHGPGADAHYVGVTTVAATSDLPKCKNSNEGIVYYVESTDQFHYCHAETMVPIDPCCSDGLNSLIRQTAIPPGSVECPAGGVLLESGLDANGNGVLDDVEVERSTVICNGADEHCDNGIDDDDDGHTDCDDEDCHSECIMMCALLTANCSGNGTCVVEGGTAQCICDVGYSGTDCGNCATGYHRDPGSDDCVLDEECPEPDPDDFCNHHGTCAVVGGIALCDCDVGYAGSQCEYCATGYQDANGDGTCEPDCSTAALGCVNGACVIDGSTGLAECDCDYGWDGPTCEECGLACAHGTCDLSTGSPECECEPGWLGTLCTFCGIECVNGTCEGDPAVCVCRDPSPEEVQWQGDACDICPTGLICSASTELCCDDAQFDSCHAATDACCKLNTCEEDYAGQCGISLDDGCGGTMNCICPAGDVCVDADSPADPGTAGTCCTTAQCGDPGVPACGAGIDDNCFGTIDCSCGVHGVCDQSSGSPDDWACDCDDNYAVFDGGQECRHVCEGFLSTHGSCCHPNTTAEGNEVSVYCVGTALTTFVCAPGTACGWNEDWTPPGFHCGGSSDPADIPDEEEPLLTCPPEVVVPVP